MNEKIRRKDIYLADFGNTVGCEEKGKRPVLIVQNDFGNKYSSTTIVIPLTKRVETKQRIPTHIEIEPFGKMPFKATILAEQIKVIDKNLESVNLDENHFKIKVGDKFINDVSFECGQVQELEDGKIVEIQLSNLNIDGILKLVFAEGFAEDDGKLNNVNTEINTDVVVDNSIPFVPVERDEFVFDGGDGAGSKLNLG